MPLLLIVRALLSDLAGWRDSAAELLTAVWDVQEEEWKGRSGSCCSESPGRR